MDEYPKGKKQTTILCLTQSRLDRVDQSKITRDVSGFDRHWLDLTRDYWSRLDYYYSFCSHVDRMARVEQESGR